MKTKMQGYYCVVIGRKYGYGFSAWEALKNAVGEKFANLIADNSKSTAFYGTQGRIDIIAKNGNKIGDIAKV